LPVDTPERIASLCMFAFAAAGAAWDVKTGKLPNRLTVPVFFAGLLFWAAAGLWAEGLGGLTDKLLFALGGFAVGFGILFGLWLVGGGGGGDVKFMGALGCWLGAWQTMQVLVLGSLIALVYTMGMFGADLVGGKGIGARGRGTGDRGQSARLSRGWGVRFGVPAALATWIVLGLKWAGFEIPWPPL
jgi:prepilin peptidase CpaA